MKFNQKELHVIKKALDFYMRVGIGQMTVIKDHPTFQSVLKKRLKEFENTGVYYDVYHGVREKADDLFTQGRNELIKAEFISENASFGLFNKKVDESCRTAYDIIHDIEAEEKEYEK